MTDSVACFAAMGRSTRGSEPLKILLRANVGIRTIVVVRVDALDPTRATKGATDSGPPHRAGGSYSRTTAGDAAPEISTDGLPVPSAGTCQTSEVVAWVPDLGRL